MSPMRSRRLPRGLLVVLAVACGAPVSARAQVTTQEGLTLSQVIQRLTFSRQLVPAGTQVAGDIIELGTALEVATTPLGTSSGSFVFKLDPTTGLQVRSAPTFGPTFTHRAMTSGEGKVAIGGNFLFATYDRFGSLPLDQMRLLLITQPTGRAVAGTTSLAISSKSLIMSGMVGVTKNLDVGVAVPLLTVKVEGVSWSCSGLASTLSPDPRCEDPNNTVISRTTGSGVSSGLGDIAVLVKYRFLKFGDDLPDPGGLAALVTTRLPTGDRDNLRGLGVNRTLVALIVSWGKGKLRPHANGGFEVWSDSVDVLGDPLTNSKVLVRHQVEYAGGVEFEAAPKLTLIGDLLGRHTLGGGRMGFVTAEQAGTTLDYAVALPKGNMKLTFAPGLKLNLKGKMLIALSALVPILDRGLHDRFTPVASVELNF